MRLKAPSVAHAFEQMDVDGGGDLDREEFKAAMIECGLSESRAGKFFDIVAKASPPYDRIVSSTDVCDKLKFHLRKVETMHVNNKL